MIRIEFTEEAIERLRYERFHHPHPRVQRKMEALLLKSQGLPHRQICEILGISENTLRSYLRAYREGGVENLKELNFPCPRSELSQHAETIEEYFRHHPPATVKEAAATIEAIAVERREAAEQRPQHLCLGTGDDNPTRQETVKLLRQSARHFQRRPRRRKPSVTLWAG